jgi:hydrogenase nickel incorporation protein HypA/HybF
MHELSIAMSILDAVEEEAAQRNYETVHAIHLKIGALSGVVPDALHSAYALAAENTRFAQTRLVIETIPITAHCSVCGGPRRIQSPQCLQCPDCQTMTPEILEGRELDISSLEVSP